MLKTINLTLSFLAPARQIQKRTNVRSLSTNGGVHSQSLANPSKFWGEAAKNIDWIDDSGPIVSIPGKPENARWFPQRSLNMAYNCVTRHVKARGSQTAIAYDSPVTNTQTNITFAELQESITDFASGLNQIGVQKGDRVLIYMPNIPEAAVAMLSCAMLGAIHSVVFGGFAPAELATRIKDCNPKVIVLASCGIDGAKIIPYKPFVDESLRIAYPQGQAAAPQTHTNPTQVIFQRPQCPASHTQSTDIDWNDLCTRGKPLRAQLQPATMLATDPLYVLYTSGTTGAPKGIVRDTGGYAVALRWSMSNVYGIKPGDVFWAASDVGWVVGHSYSVYGPLLTGATSVLYEGKPVGTPDSGAFWRVIQQHKVKALFTAPTAIRAIKRTDHDGVNIKRYDTSSMHTLFLAGEHADPDTVKWAERVLKVPVVDNWWQTETGWPICANMVGAEGHRPPKYGSTFTPCPGYDLQVLNPETNVPVPASTMGALAIKLPLPPGCLMTIFNSDARYQSAYMTKRPGYYDTGDNGFIDEDGYVFVMSRADDVINVAGHRLSTGGMEEVLSEHEDIAEVAVIGVKDPLKGQTPVGLFVLYDTSAHKSHEEIIDKAVELIRTKIGAVACFKEAYIVPKLPKTRSGKVLRGTMRAIANGDSYTVPSTIEDVDVLADIERIIKHHETTIARGQQK